MPSRLAKLNNDLHDIKKDLGNSLAHDLLQVAETHVRFAYQASCMSESLDHSKHRDRVMTELLEPLRSLAREARDNPHATREGLQAVAEKIIGKADA
jgi:hypothetical protein